jgi:MoaA/NifB/PqqE/SkfB family radical SAM enzyme
LDSAAFPFFPGITLLYRNLMHAHSSVPFYFDPSGHAFPAWHFFFEVTRRCNLRCRMCQYHDWFERNPASQQLHTELTTAEWQRLVDETGRLSIISFTGGEPFVRNDFDDILAYAAARRRVHVITNGLLLNQERANCCVSIAANRLGGKGLNFLGVSIDGPSTIHNTIRGRQDAFETTSENLKELARNRDSKGKSCPRVHVTTVMQPDNIDLLSEMPAIVAALGADVLNLTMEVRFPELEGMGKQDPVVYSQEMLRLPQIPTAQLKNALLRTREAAQKAGIELRLPTMPLSEILKYHAKGQDIRRYQCRSAWTNLHIGAQGDAFPCVLHHIGNVREAGLKSLWNNKKMCAFRRRVRKSPFLVCQGCCHLEYKGNCSIDADE